MGPDLRPVFVRGVQCVYRSPETRLSSKVSAVTEFPTVPGSRADGGLESRQHAPAASVPGSRAEGSGASETTVAGTLVGKPVTTCACGREQGACGVGIQCVGALGMGLVVCAFCSVLVVQYLGPELYHADTR